MLTKQDLNQIKKITHDAVKEGTKTLRVDVSSLKTSVSRLETDLKIVKKDVKKIDKKFDDLFDFIDKDHMRLVKRVVRIEDNLGIRPVVDF